jgi:hypothetical protein
LPSLGLRRGIVDNAALRCGELVVIEYVVSEQPIERLAASG